MEQPQGPFRPRRDKRDDGVQGEGMGGQMEGIRREDGVHGSGGDRQGAGLSAPEMKACRIVGAEQQKEGQ